MENNVQVYRYPTGMIQANTYLAFDETKKGFIVDPGDYSAALKAKADEEGVDIQYIILTHGHCDHIGGVDKFKEVYPYAKVVAYMDEKEMLSDWELNSSLELAGRKVTVDADIYVNDNDKMTVGSTELTFVHTPGHTKGGMCIITDGFVFSGDTLFRASIGRTDFYGGDFNAIITSIKERLFTLPDDTVVLTGHMGETTIGYEKENNPFV